MECDESQQARGALRSEAPEGPADRPSRHCNWSSGSLRSFSSWAANGLVHVAVCGVAPDVHPLSPVRSCAGDDKHSPDLPTDSGEFLAHDAVPDASEFSQRLFTHSRGEPL